MIHILWDNRKPHFLTQLRLIMLDGTELILTSCRPAYKVQCWFLRQESQNIMRWCCWLVLAASPSAVGGSCHAAKIFRFGAGGVPLVYSWIPCCGHVIIRIISGWYVFNISYVSELQYALWIPKEKCFHDYDSWIFSVDPVTASMRSRVKGVLRITWIFQMHYLFFSKLHGVIIRKTTVWIFTGLEALNVISTSDTYRPTA